MSWFDDSIDTLKTPLPELTRSWDFDPVDDAYHFFNPQQADSLYNGGGSMSEDLNNAASNAMWESTATPHEKKLAHSPYTNPNADWTHNPFAYLYD